MSRLGAKTYSRKPDCKTSVQFDTLLSDKGNSQRPSTAKVSVAGIHRWGMTSYTSLRKSRLNGQKDIPEAVEPVKRAKLEPTPVVESYTDPFSFESDFNVKTPHNVIQSPVSKPEAKPAAPKPNKFFKSSGSRLGKNSRTKNSDFDAVRLSVPVALNSLKGNDMLNVQPNDFTVVSDESLYLTQTKPNAVDFQYASSSPGNLSSTVKASVHYVTPFIHSVVPDDASSKAFDALLDLSNKDNSTISQQFTLPTDLSNKDEDVFLSQRGISSESFLNQTDNTYSVVRESHSVNDYGQTNEKIEDEHELFSHKKFNAKTIAQESNMCTTESTKIVSKKQRNERFGSSKPDLNPTVLSSDEQGSLETIHLSSSQSQSSSQEDILSSQSSDKTSDYNSSQGSKQSTRSKKIFSSSLKFKAVYNHRHWHSSKKSEESTETQPGVSLADEFEDETMKENFQDDIFSEVANTSSGDIRSYKCPKASKEFYTVVKNVKQAYQCHESGETQEFNDDIEYLLECVQECNAIGTRCLSILNLAAKCMGSAFRIHLRAHGTMPKIFSALKDAPTDPNLALCTATLMFVLSQDRLTMDIEASTLSLMLQLLESDPELRNPEKEIDLILKDPALCAMQDKHREKVFSLCEEMQQKGHAKHLKLDTLNTGILAMETLLSLTSRKAGEWFKEEMRTLGGLDRIADTVTSSVELLIPEETEIINHPNEVQLDKLKKIDRCLRVLENVTHMNSENQEYLMAYKDSSLVLSCLSLIKLCKSHFLQQKPIDTDATVEESSQKGVKEESPLISCLLNILKILSNITYMIPLEDTQFPEEDGLMDQILMLILQVPRAVPLDKRFDLLVLSLGLMINLVEYSVDNSSKFMEMFGLGSFDTVNDGYEMSATEALIELMLGRLEAARVSEEQADELLSSQEEKHAASIAKKDIETAADDLEETLIKTLQKAGKHMEHSIIAAYIVILLGCVSQKNADFIEVMKEYVPDGKFDVMVEVLKKFKSFVSLTGSVGNRELVSIQKVIHILETS